MERSGRIRFIAFAASQRDKIYPQVPARRALAFAASRLPVGPACAPRSAPVSARLRIADDLGEAIKAPAVMERYASLGFEAPDLATDRFAELINKETEAWAETIRRAGIQIE